MRSKWDERYDREEYIYGFEPNVYFKKFIDVNPPGKILLPCEGEGRNAVYAAKNGYNVVAFDSSEVAKSKALKLAKEKGVKITYHVFDIEGFKSDKFQDFDYVGLIYSHLKSQIRKTFHSKLRNSLSKRGKIVLEAYNKKQINYESGGPRSIELLYDKDILATDFNTLNILELEEKKTDVQEGLYHSGTSEIIRMIAQKL